MKRLSLILLLLAAIVPGQALANTFSGQATVVNSTVLGTNVTLVNAGPLPSSGGSEHDTLADLSVPGVLTAQVGHAAAVAMGDSSRAEASVANLDLSVAGNTIGARFLMARALATCSDSGASASGSSEIAELVINGQTIAVTGAPNQEIPLPGGGKVTINEQSSSTSGNTASMDVTALHVFIPNPAGGPPIADIKIANAHADITCTGTKTCPQDKDFVTGGGRIAVSGGNATFAVAGGIKNGAFWGHLTYIDHATGMKVKGTGVTAYTTPDPVNKPTLRHIEGNCDINGQSGTYRVDVDDEGEPGRSDTFFIQLSNGYTAGAGETLVGGNIQLHLCK